MILSIQSHVAYGYVGNRVATFILQRMGFDVVTINTVQFSNHTGYGAFSGEVFTRDHLMHVLDGLEKVGALKQCTALLSGYLGSSDTADIVLEAHARLQQFHPDLFYICDPVMGDVGRGLFVKPEIPQKFKHDVIQKALCITPNLFELQVLTDATVTTMDDLKASMLSLPNHIVIVTSVDLFDLDPTKIYMVMREGENFYVVEAPRFFFQIPPNGSGDAVSSLFLGHYLREKNAAKALDLTNKAMHHLFRLTHDRGERELALIQAQDLF